MTTRFAALVVATVTVLAACGGAPAVPVDADGDPDVVLERGRDVFAQRCAVCHGANAGGGRGPKLRDGAAVDLYPQIEDMVTVIGDGKGSGMPSFGDILNADDRLAVARYIREVLG